MQVAHVQPQHVVPTVRLDTVDHVGRHQFVTLKAFLAQRVLLQLHAPQPTPCHIVPTLGRRRPAGVMLAPAIL